MALHDISRSDNRNKLPAPNAADAILPGQRMAHSTTGFTLVNQETPSDTAILTIKDGKMQLIKDGNTYIDASDGNVEVYKNDGGVVSRLGQRPSDADGAVETAKPGQSI